VALAPPAPETAGIRAVPGAAEVVDQGVEPHVHDLTGVAGDRHAPAAGPRDTAGDAEVLQPRLDERQHLPAPCGRLDPQPAGDDQLPEPFLVRPEPEEPVRLLDRLRHGAVLGTPPVHQLLGPVEELAADAVEPRVGLAVEVAA